MRGIMTVTSAADYETWAKQASADSERRYDETDSDARWGWEWEM